MDEGEKEISLPVLIQDTSGGHHIARTRRVTYLAGKRGGRNQRESKENLLQRNFIQNEIHIKLPKARNS
jgi:hypothetical protein